MDLPETQTHDTNMIFNPRFDNVAIFRYDSSCDIYCIFIPNQNSRVALWLRGPSSPDSKLLAPSSGPDV